MTIPTDSRRDSACCHAAVIALSTAIMRFDAIFHQNAVRSARRVARAMLNDREMRAVFINLKPPFALAGGGESPLSDTDAPCLPRQRGLSWGMPRGRKFPALQQGRRGR
jgi:hypothetical protein